MSDKPLISIVVPTYNRADLITKTLDSLLQQECGDYEIIVVDDGSTDNTEERVQAYLGERLRYYKKNNAERAAARNYGAQKAQGRYVNFFDSDDIALPNHIAEAKKLIDAKNSPEWFHLAYAWADPDQQVFKEENKLTGATLNSLLPHGNRLSCNGVFIRRDIILQFPFNETRALSASEDFELWIRLSVRFPLYYANSVTSLVIDHDMRSVRTIYGKQLIERLDLLVRSLEADTQVTRTLGKDFKYIKADSLSYVALHLAAQTNSKLSSLQYVFKTLLFAPVYLTKRRFYATVRDLVFRWKAS